MISIERRSETGGILNKPMNQQYFLRINADIIKMGELWLVYLFSRGDAIIQKVNTIFYLLAYLFLSKSPLKNQTYIKQR